MKIPAIIMCVTLCVTLCGLITHSKGLDSLGPVAHYLERDYLGASKMKEQWKPIVGHERTHEISNMGRIKSLHKKHQPGYKILKPTLIPKGYYIITLCNEKLRTYRVHCLVARAFIGERPTGLVVDHKDRNPWNNVYTNLRYTTNRENISRGKRSALNSNKSSQYRGVHWDKSRKKWTASIQINGVAINLGGYLKEEDAAQVYQNKLKELPC